MGLVNLGNIGKAGSVTTGLIAANAIVASLIAANAVVGSHVSAGVIVASHIGANAVVGAAISAAVIQASHLAAGLSGKAAAFGMAAGVCDATNRVFTATGSLTPAAYGVHPRVDGIEVNDNVTAVSDCTAANQVFFASTDAVIFTLGVAPDTTSSVFTLTIQ